MFVFKQRRESWLSAAVRFNVSSNIAGHLTEMSSINFGEDLHSIF
jgi:hypothetical protein